MQKYLSSVNSESKNDLADLAIPHLIVFGGTSGLGLALALYHRNLGWQVSVVGHSQDKIAQINKDHADITSYHYDLTDLEQRQRLLKELEQVSFDRLIYSAGSYLNERVHKLDKANSDVMLAINLQAFQQVFSWGSQQLKGKQVENKTLRNSISNSTTNPKPSLICIASIAGTMDYPYASLYAKSKRAMIATANAYRLALAPYDIQVICIASGYIDTQALRDLNNGDASHKPFIISTDKAVRLIMQAIDENTELAIIPRPMLYITSVLNKLPKPLLNLLLRSKLDKM